MFPLFSSPSHSAFQTEQFPGTVRFPLLTPFFLVQGKQAFKETFRIKVSLDGAKMTRRTNFIVLSFSILNDGEDVMTSKGKLLCSSSCCLLFDTNVQHKPFLATGNDSITVVNGPEEYDTLKTSFSNCFAKMNSIIEDGGVEIN